MPTSLAISERSAVNKYFIFYRESVLTVLSYFGRGITYYKSCLEFYRLVLPMADLSLVIIKNEIFHIWLVTLQHTLYIISALYSLYEWCNQKFMLRKSIQQRNYLKTLMLVVCVIFCTYTHTQRNTYYSQFTHFLKCKTYSTWPIAKMRLPVDRSEKQTTA